METLKNVPLGLIERVEFHARVLDHLVRYQSEMRQFFLRRIEELTHDVRGAVPTPDFPSFEQWSEMITKQPASAAVATEGYGEKNAEAPLRQFLDPGRYRG